MNLFENQDRWYSVFVKTGDEDNVRKRLEYRFTDRNFNVFVPKRMLRERKNGLWETKIRSLFPGYILMKGLLGCSEYYLTKNVPGLIRLLRDNTMFYEIVPDEMKILGKLICNGEIIGSSRILFKSGRVVVVDGPLLGLEGLIESVDKRKGRAKVKFNLIGELRLVDLAVDVIQPL